MDLNEYLRWRRQWPLPPKFPWRRFGIPIGLQQPFVAQRVHALPETLMAIGCELAFLN